MFLIILARRLTNRIWFICVTVKRNKRGDDKLYVSSENGGYSTLNALYKKSIDFSAETEINIDGIHGTILPCDENIAGGK